MKTILQLKTKRMKTKKFFIVIVAFVFAANVFATETPKMSIIPLKDTKALVAFEQATPSVNEITITDETGKIRYYKKSKNEMKGYKKVFDLSQLENGTYVVKLKAGTTTYKTGLAINDGKVSVQKQRIEVDPYFSFKDNVVNVSYLNHRNEDVVVSVYNSKSSKLIFSANFGNEFAVQRAINLSELKSGNYDVMLASSDQEYWFSVSR